jgi:pyrroline-5-carboxylate reductase
MTGKENSDQRTRQRRQRVSKEGSKVESESTDASTLRISIIGGGNMATALVGGLAGKLTLAANLHVVEIDPAARERMTVHFGVRCSSEIDATVMDSDVIVLAIKPQQIHEVVLKLQPFIGAQLLLSIAAGIRAADLSRWLDGYGAIVRSMPNTPALIGKGITGMVALAGVNPDQRAYADAIMRAVGTTLWLEDEALIDAVTAISGSGPAYVFYFMEAMQKAGEKMGLTSDQATELSIATFLGAAQLAANTTDPVTVLRERVTSKGGTTYAAISSMNEGNVSTSIIKAIEAAAARSTALGDEFGKV